MPEVIISGAGPAGLTLAIELARRDVDFVLIDKASHPLIGSRGKGIQPRTLEVFEDLGVLDRMVAAGGEYPLQRVYTEDGPVDRRVMEHQDPAPAEPYRNALMLPQFRTESVLRDRLAELGHAPRYQYELLSFDAVPHHRRRMGGLRQRHRAPGHPRLHGVDSAEHRSLHLRPVQAWPRLLRRHPGGVREVLRGHGRAGDGAEHADAPDPRLVGRGTAGRRSGDGLGVRGAATTPAARLIVRTMGGAFALLVSPRPCVRPPDCGYVSPGGSSIHDDQGDVS